MTFGESQELKTHNPANERVKHRYFTYLKEAKRCGEASIDAVAKALNRFERYTRFRDFQQFRPEQAVAFKRHLSEQLSTRTGEKLSKATLHSTLNALRNFFFWLAGQPGFRSRLSYSDADYFNLSAKETSIAKARRETAVPTMDQIMHVLRAMPSGSAIERRDRAIIACTLLTGIRDRALVSLRLKHVHLDRACVVQDAREVQTKFSKTSTTFFFPVEPEVARIVEEWVCHLLRDQLWSRDDPLFRLLVWSPAQIANLRWRDWIGNIGLPPGRSGGFSNRHLRRPDYPISHRTAFAKRWLGMASRFAAPRRSSRHGARIWPTSWS